MPAQIKNSNEEVDMCGFKVPAWYDWSCEKLENQMECVLRQVFEVCGMQSGIDEVSSV